MELNGPKTHTQSNAGNTQNTTSTTWSVGQRLNATVISHSTNGNVTLNIAGKIYSTSTSAPIKTGQTLQLGVLSVAGLPTAKALNMPMNSPLSSQSSANQNSTLTQTPQSQLISLNLPESLRASLGKGDIFNARVMQTINSSQVLLSISNQQIIAHTTAQLSPEKPLTLQLVSTGGPPSLQILTSLESHAGVMPYLRENIALQQGYAPLLANLLYLSVHDLNASASVAVQLRQIARHLLNNLSTPRQLSSANGLKQGLRQSGLFFESLLKALAYDAMPLKTPLFKTNPEHPINDLTKTDLKSNLLRLLQYLSEQRTTSATTKPPSVATMPDPPLRHSQPVAQGTAQASVNQQLPLTSVLDKLFTQTKGVLARILLSQLASGEHYDDGKRIIMTEIPVHHGQGIEILQFRIEQDTPPPKGNNQPPIWSVMLAFEFAKMGPVRVKITQHIDKIYINFWSEQHFTQAFITQHLELLRDNISALGIQVTQLNSYHGKPPPPKNDEPQQNGMLDINV